MVEQTYDRVVAQLRTWAKQIVRDDSDQDLKVEIERAIGCLNFCSSYAIRPARRVIRLPDPQTLSPSSEFRVVEDNESDEREHWIEVEVDGESIRPVPGSIILEY